jgi:hypothetical protein
MADKTPSQHPRGQHAVGGEGEALDHNGAGHQGMAPGDARSTPHQGHGNDPHRDSDEETYCVGYCRPPLHSRFRPGQSGNPKGRAKQSRNLPTIVKQVLSEHMQLREGGRFRRMPAMEALVRTLLARSFKGDPKSLASLVVLLRQCGLTEGDETMTELLNGPDYDAIIADFLARNGVEDAPRDDEVNAPASPIATPTKREG